MKVILHKILPALLGLVLMTGCKKSFLEREPYGGLPTADALKTVDDMETALNGAYADMRGSGLFGRAIPLIGDLLADNVYLSPTNSNRYTSVYLANYTVNNTDVQGIWNGCYNTILDANNVINSSLTGSAEADEFRGEALAIRALMYFELVKHFAKSYTVDPGSMGVPLILTYDAFKKPTRNTVAEVYTQIEKDLKDAMPLMTLGRSSGYFSAAAAEALLARLYTFKADWPNALAAAEDVINNSGYSLVTLNRVAGYWASNTPRNDGIETLFEIVNDLVGNAANDALASFYDQAAYGDALCSQSLYNMYSNTDVRKSLILTFSPRRGNVKVVNKYPNTSQPDKDEVKVIRMSEVFLIAAEAAYHGGPANEALAKDYLNAVASERDPNFAGYSSTGAALLEDILLERRKELAFEGHRYWDLVRYNRDVMRVNLSNNYAGAPLTIPASSVRRIFPIPQSELDANPAIRTQQNPGY
jgi:starch-binding outer membrane protein, SusD/RagB family